MTKPRRESTTIPNLEPVPGRRVVLEPEAARSITIPLCTRACSQWDVAIDRLRSLPGRYPIAVGALSRDLRLRWVVRR